MRWQIALVMLAALAARLVTGPRPIDDAYITFRYARNLAEGAGLVYNPGEWVLGTTTPLWALLLALGHSLGAHDLPWLATILSGLCDAATAGLLALLALRLGCGRGGALAVGLAWAVNPMSIAFASGGMEASLFVLLAMASLSLAAGGRVLPAGLIAGVAVFVRPEAVLLVAAVLGWAWWTRRRVAIQATLMAVTPVLVGALALYEAYGSPIPHSVLAKRAAYTAPWLGENLAALAVQAGLPGWSPFLLNAAPTAAALIVAALGLATLTVLIKRALSRTSTVWQPFAAFGSLYVLFYASVGLGGVRLFPWYLVAPIPLYLLGAAAGLRTIHVSWRALLPAALVLWQLPAIDWTRPLMPLGVSLERERVLLQVGESLSSRLPKDAVVAAPEIGALGYASRLRILDTVGLVSPVARGYYPLPPEQLVTDNAVPAQLIVDQQPDAVVTMDAFAQRSLLVNDEFQRAYWLDQAYPVDVWQSSQLLVFRRVDAAGTR